MWEKAVLGDDQVGGAAIAAPSPKVSGKFKLNLKGLISFLVHAGSFLKVPRFPIDVRWLSSRECPTLVLLVSKI